ncbi:MAG: hypothetical protein AMJ81_05900 [Phycisphaerae bacterium SM23_33]|nr:MAG: hypothetical protein AMJ81_05900 [Phycisphaerae bacterium SM23_33]
MQQPHILLISLDTVRRDYLGCYGHDREVTPHLDRLAEGGVRFADAVANCGWTLPQHVTLLTGLYPLTHGCLLLRDNPPLSWHWTLLAEHLKRHGYRTFAGVSNRNHYGGGACFGFDRGFDEHNPGAEYNRHMDWTERFIVQRLRDHHAAAPCFVYVHVNDTHEPWTPPAPWADMWGSAYRNRYEGELSYVDHHLGRVFAALKEMGLFERTLTVIFSDHGTEFAEHGFYEKKVNLYNEILHVPLLFHCPALLPAGRVVDGLAESADVAPTLCDVAGLPPLPQAQGRSLLPRIRGEGGPAPECVCAHTVHEHQRDGGPPQFDHYAIHTRDWKFIRLEVHAQPDALHSDWKRRCQAIMLRAGRDPAELARGTVVRELYDLRQDPGEQRSLLSSAGGPPDWRSEVTGEARAVAADLEARLDEWIAQTRAAAVGPSH